MFLIETYLARARSSALPDVAAALEDAALGARRPDGGGAGVRHLRSFYVAGDELAYHLVEAASADVAEELGKSIGLVAERIVEVEAAPRRLECDVAPSGDDPAPGS